MESLLPKHKKQVAEKILSLCEIPFPSDSKKLKGYFLYRTDSGEYRIIYEVDEKMIEVHLVGKRNDEEVYKQLKRIFGS